MNKDKVQNIAFLVILICFVIVAGMIFYPFLGPFAVALTMAIIFSPVHQEIKKIFRSKTLSAVITMVLAFVIVLIPLAFVATNVFSEARQVYQGSTDTAAINGLTEKIQDVAAKYAPWMTIDFASIKDQIVSWVVDNFTSLFSSAFKIGFNVFIVVLTLFYLLRDGESFRAKFSQFSPLRESDNDMLMKKVKETVTSVVRGSLLVAILQGCVTGLGLFIFGVPQPVLWGSVAAVAALVPALGTSLVIVPCILYLLYAGQYASAIGLSIWGSTFIHLVDNILGPYLIQRGIKIHPLFILMSVIGGIGFFGPIGFILGPIVLSLTVTLLNTYSAIESGETK